MDRKEEFDALRQELERTPAELEHSVTRARARARHHRRLRWAGIPLAGAAALFLAFTLMVNVSTSFAAAVAEVPALGPLSAALRWRGSVRTAAEHGYVQAVGESQTVNGITMTLDYLIADQKKVSIGYTASCDQPGCTVKCVGLGGGLEDQSGWVAAFDVISNGEGQSLIVVEFQDRLLTDLSPLTITLAAVPEGASAMDSQDRADFTFEVEAVLTGPQELTIGQWVELEGNRLWLDRVDIYPTSAQLYVTDDKDNGAWFNGLEFHLEDGEGNCYGPEGSMLGEIVNEGDNNYVLWFATPWFAPDSQLTLHITGSSWSAKGEDGPSAVVVDLVNGTASGLPDKLTYVGAEQVVTATAEDGSDQYSTRLTFRAEGLPAQMSEQSPLPYLFQHLYVDADGEGHPITTMGYGLRQSDGSYPILVYVDCAYEGDTLTLYLQQTDWNYDIEPLVIPIR